jgi:hypothetical protein
MNMLKRISHKKPAISREKQANDWKQNLTFMSNISAFPEDWYLKEKLMTSRSNPNMSMSSNKTKEESIKKTTSTTDDEAEKEIEN